MAGLRLGLDRLVGIGLTGLWVAVLGMLFCLVGGFGLASWWGSPAEEAIYIGVALTATSIAISVQLLHQFGLVELRVGRIVIAAAVIDDILALYLLAAAHGVLTNALAPARIAASLVLVMMMLAAIFMVCRWLAQQMVKVPIHIRTVYLLPVILVVIVSFGWLTHTLGYSQVVGGFFAGLGFTQGHISHHVLVALVMVTIGAALIGPLLAEPLAKAAL